MIMMCGLMRAIVSLALTADHASRAEGHSSFSQGS